MLIGVAYDLLLPGMLFDIPAPVCVQSYFDKQSYLGASLNGSAQLTHCTGWNLGEWKALKDSHKHTHANIQVT